MFSVGSKAFNAPPPITTETSAPPPAVRPLRFGDASSNERSNNRTNRSSPAPRRAAPEPSLAQKVLAGTVGDYLPAVGAGAVLLSAALVTVGGVFAAKAVSDKLEGHKWGTCHWKYNEKWASICENSVNDFWLPLLSFAPEFAVSALAVKFSGKAYDTVKSQVDAARRAVDLHHGSTNV